MQTPVLVDLMLGLVGTRRLSTKRLSIGLPESSILVLNSSQG